MLCERHFLAHTRGEACTILSSFARSGWAGSRLTDTRTNHQPAAKQPRFGAAGFYSVTKGMVECGNYNMVVLDSLTLP